MELLHIPLSELAIAKVNVRHGVKKADYKDLACSESAYFFICDSVCLRSAKSGGRSLRLATTRTDGCASDRQQDLSLLGCG
jgi:hypothetical protein